MQGALCSGARGGYVVCKGLCKCKGLCTECKVWLCSSARGCVLVQGAMSSSERGYAACKWCLCSSARGGHALVQGAVCNMQGGTAHYFKGLCAVCKKWLCISARDFALSCMPINA